MRICVSNFRQFHSFLRQALFYRIASWIGYIFQKKCWYLFLVFQSSVPHLVESLRSEWGPGNEIRTISGQGFLKRQSGSWIGLWSIRTRAWLFTIQFGNSRTESGNVICKDISVLFAQKVFFIFLSQNSLAYDDRTLIVNGQVKCNRLSLFVTLFWGRLFISCCNDTFVGSIVFTAGLLSQYASMFFLTSRCRIRLSEIRRNFFGTFIFINPWFEGCWKGDGRRHRFCRGGRTRRLRTWTWSTSEWGWLARRKCPCSGKCLLSAARGLGSAPICVRTGSGRLTFDNESIVDFCRQRWN